MYLLVVIRPFVAVLRRLKLWFRNLKLKKKILILFFFIVLFLSSFGVILFNFSLDIYENQLYSNTAQILKLAIQNIENEMRTTRQLVSTLATDRFVQQYITDGENAGTEYDKYKLRMELMSYLYSAVNSKKYIVSINYIDEEGQLYSVGDNASDILDDKIDKFYTYSLEYGGQSAWLNPTDGDDMLTLVCEIREVKGLSLRTMGVLVTRIDISKLVEETMDISSQNSENCYIYVDNRQIYRYADEPEPFDITRINRNQKYTIHETGRGKKFTVQVSSSYSDWDYYFSIPYNNIFLQFNRIRNYSLIIYVLMFGIALIAGFTFSRSITLPINRLIMKMQGIGGINFDSSNISFAENYRKDEVGILNETYQTMIKEIETLIQENYVKQLVIKDTQYRALQAQINPHFIYNTIDSIYWLAMDKKQREVASMIFSFGKLMREMINNSETNEHLLRDELAVLSHYVIIQKMRFKERLEMLMEIDDNTLDCRIPKLLLQPLVENSINYGLESIRDTCIIKVNTSIIDGKMLISVEDNGIGTDLDILDKLKKGRAVPKGNGIGLLNIDARITLLYGLENAVKIKHAEGQGTIVEVFIPLEEECDV